MRNIFILNEPFCFSLSGFGRYIGDIVDDVDLRSGIFVVGIVTIKDLVDEEIGVVSLEGLFFEIPEDTDDGFFGSELLRRFNGLWCSCGLVIGNDFVLLFTDCVDMGNSLDFFGLIGGEVGKLLIAYNDKSTRSNLRKHRNLGSSCGRERVGFGWFSVWGNLSFNGGTRGWTGSDEAFPESKHRKVNKFNTSFCTSALLR